MSFARVELTLMLLMAEEPPSPRRADTHETFGSAVTTAGRLSSEFLAGNANG